MSQQPSQHLSDIHLQVLVFLSLLGEATDEEVAHVSDLPAEDCEAEMLDLAATGLAKWGGGSAGWRITDLGRTEHAVRVNQELVTLGLRDEVQGAYDAVLAAGDDRDAVLAATEGLIARMRRFGAYGRRLRDAAGGPSGAAQSGTAQSGTAQSDEPWALVRDQLLEDLRITLA